VLATLCSAIVRERGEASRKIPVRMPNCSDHTRKTPLLFAGRKFTDLSVPFEFASNPYTLSNGKAGSLFKQW
jgi:hypothetical protein